MRTLKLLLLMVAVGVPVVGGLPGIGETPPALGQEQVDSSRQAEADRLLEQGNQQYRVSQFRDALQSWQTALEIYQAIGDRAGESKTLNNIGLVNDLLGNYPEALDYYEQSLVITRAIGDSPEERLRQRVSEAATLNNIGIVNRLLGDYPAALDYYEQSLVITRQIGDRAGEANTLHNIGIVNQSLGNYPAALDYYEQSLVITREIGDSPEERLRQRATEAKTLTTIGAVNQSLGNYPEALDYYQQSLVITGEIGDRATEAQTLNNIGIVNRLLGNYPAALDYYEQSLVITRAIGDPASEANTLLNIGSVHVSLNEDEEALNYYQQSLVIREDIGDYAGQASSLWGIALIDQRSGNYTNALTTYQRGLAISREVGAQAEEAAILNALGRVFEASEQRELAIVFFKESINTYETIRQSNQALEQSLQDSYTTTIESTYRRLADLLLQQDRILEAQRVLDLLRVQELDTYLRGVRGTADTQAGVALRPDEQAIIDLYTANQDKLIELGRKQAELAKIAPDQRTPQQQARIVELRQLEQAVLLTFQTFFEQTDIVTLVTRLRSTLGAANIELPELNGLRDNLQRLDQNAVVLYPLVLDNRLELVLVTPGQAPIRRTVPVTRLELNRAIGELRYALESPTRDAVTPAQQLYNWLIRPIEADLQQAEAKTIIYSPDLRLRYVPLAAMHDGDSWLIESYSVNNITAASLADLNHIPNRGDLSVLAAAFTEGRYEFQVGNRTTTYNGLTHAGPEIEALTRLIPGTVARLNQAFTPSLIFEMDDYRIIHLATHAAFNPGGLDNSYILFGNGEKATLADVKGWSFPNVDLVVLSACETAVGDVLRAEETLAAGNPSGSINGEEILGFGYLMQLAGADAAIGSLWKVDDGGTQILMSAFYDALSRGGLAKAAALQQAQLDLIRIGEGDNRGGFELAQELGLDPDTLAHPHYWAPFILIGNGL